MVQANRSLPNERPPSVRRSKAELRARVNGQLTFRYERAGLTSYAGLEFVRRWLRRDGLLALLRRELAAGLPPSDYGVLGLALVVLALILSGGRRLRHLRYLDGDPLVLRFCGLRHLPTARTVGRWLAAFRARHLPRLQQVNALVAARVIRHTGQRRLTIDVDGSVVSTGLQVAWLSGASIPIGASSELLPDHRVERRGAGAAGAESARQHPRGKASLTVLRAFLHTPPTLGGATPLEFRMMGCPFPPRILAFSGRRADYAMKVPFYPWVGLKALVQRPAPERGAAT